jgi:16S rRNA G966 N2-methylase RsmD
MTGKILCPKCGEEFNWTNYSKHLEEKYLPNGPEFMYQTEQELLFPLEFGQASEECNVAERVANNYGQAKENEKVSFETDQARAWTQGPENFQLEINTVWSFPDRGSWATHNGKYRGNWSPYIPRNVIERYSKEGETVLDQFVGSGTTLTEVILLKRKGIGVDINPRAIELSRKNTNFNGNNARNVKLHVADARKLNFIKDASIDLICTHPPYSDIIKYSEDLENDMSHLGINDFLQEMESVALECYRVLKKDKYCAILIGDIRKHGHVVPLGFNTMELFINSGFKLKEIVIKQQHNCNSTSYWRDRSQKYNFLLLAHEYLFVFHKL